MSSKSILIILSYTVSKFAYFLRHSVDITTHEEQPMHHALCHIFYELRVCNKIHKSQPQ